MKFLSLLFFSLIMSFTVFSQTSGPANKKYGVLQNGRIYTVFGNSGVIGQPSDKGPRGAWGHQNNGYIGDLSFILSGKARMQPGTDFSSPIIKKMITANGDSVFYFTTTCDFARPSSKDYLPGAPGDGYLVFQPKPGYANPDQPLAALSDNNSTWPADWTDYKWFNPDWKGKFFESVFAQDDRADVEFNRAPFHYQPVKNDASVTGLGLEVKTNYLLPDALDSLSGVQKNVLFAVYEVSNKSDYIIENFALSWLVGGYIGITGDKHLGEYDDDAYGFDGLNKILYSYDFPQNNSRNPDWVGSEVGYFGTKVIQSPDMAGWNWVNAFYPSNDIDFIDDTNLFKKLRTTYILENQGYDGDAVVTTGEISLKPGETKVYIISLGFGDDLSDLTTNLLNAANGWKNGFSATPNFVAIKNEGTLYNQKNQKIEFKSQLNQPTDYYLTMKDKNEREVFNLVVDPVSQKEVSLDFSEIPSDGYSLSLKPVSGSGPTDKTSIQINEAWKSYQDESWKAPYNSVTVHGNPEIASNKDDYQFRLTWENINKGITTGKLKIDLLDNTGSILENDIPFSEDHSTVKSYGRLGYSVTINNLLLKDKLDLSSVQVTPDSLILVATLFSVEMREIKLYVSGDSLISFIIQPGSDLSVEDMALFGLPATKTQFTVLDPITLKKIPFLFYDYEKDGKLGLFDEVTLLYTMPENYTQTDSVIRGLEGTPYRLANRIEITDKNLNGGIVETASVNYNRVPRSPVIIPVSGSTVLSTKNEIPSSFKIGNPYPNPFNPSVSIQISVLNQSLPVEMKVFNVLGQLISNQSLLPSGNSVMTWNGKSQNGNSVPSGTYFLEFKQGTNHAVRKAVLIK